jgi:hypothetical protein
LVKNAEKRLAATALTVLPSVMNASSAPFLPLRAVGLIVILTINAALWLFTAAGAALKRSAEIGMCWRSI